MEVISLFTSCTVIYLRANSLPTSTSTSSAGIDFTQHHNIDPSLTFQQKPRTPITANVRTTKEVHVGRRDAEGGASECGAETETERGGGSGGEVGEERCAACEEESNENHWQEWQGISSEFQARIVHQPCQKVTFVRSPLCFVCPTNSTRPTQDTWRRTRASRRATNAT